MGRGWGSLHHFFLVWWVPGSYPLIDSEQRKTEPRPKPSDGAGSLWTPPTPTELSARALFTLLTPLSLP